VSRFGQALTLQIPRLRRYAMALAGDAALADDLVQDCLERAWSRQHQWREGSDLRAWLFTILHSQFINHVRRRRRTADDIPLENGQEPSSPDTPERAMTVRDIEAAVAELVPEQRAVFLLVSLEGMTYEETAAILDVPLGTVMSRLFRARERLRRILSGDLTSRLRRIK
jgi:RNA polymerase sigma-70 factor (ECF subfamily)